MYKNKTNKRISLLKITIPILIICAIVAFAAVQLRSDDSPATQAMPETEKEIINLDPPTQKEQDQVTEQKEAIVENEQQIVTLAETVAVAIVDANQYGAEVEVRAFASNVIANGTCTILFEKNELSITKEVNAFADATTTPCINLVVPRSEFTEPGEWTITVTYANETSKGSAKSTLVIE